MPFSGFYYYRCQNLFGDLEKNENRWPTTTSFGRHYNVPFRRIPVRDRDIFWTSLEHPIPVWDIGPLKGRPYHVGCYLGIASRECVACDTPKRFSLQNMRKFIESIIYFIEISSLEWHYNQVYVQNVGTKSCGVLLRVRS